MDELTQKQQAVMRTFVNFNEVLADVTANHESGVAVAGTLRSLEKRGLLTAEQRKNSQGWHYMLTDAGRQWLEANRYILNDASERPDHPHSIRVSANEAIQRMAEWLTEDPLCGVAIWDTQNMTQPVLWAVGGEVNAPAPDADGWWAVGRQMSAIVNEARD
jgi:hypothetical protein